MKAETVKELSPFRGETQAELWHSRTNYSTYYDYEIDKQCKVPIRDINEVRAELEQKLEHLERIEL